MEMVEALESWRPGRPCVQSNESLLYGLFSSPQFEGCGIPDDDGRRLGKVFALRLEGVGGWKW